MSAGRVAREPERAEGRELVVQARILPAAKARDQSSRSLIEAQLATRWRRSGGELETIAAFPFGSVQGSIGIPQQLIILNWLVSLEACNPETGSHANGLTAESEA